VVVLFPPPSPFSEIKTASPSGVKKQSPKISSRLSVAGVPRVDIGFCALVEDRGPWKVGCCIAIRGGAMVGLLVFVFLSLELLWLRWQGGGTRATTFDDPGLLILPISIQW